jgi:hypothetical protein
MMTKLRSEDMAYTMIRTKEALMRTNGRFMETILPTALKPSRLGK